MKEFILYDPSGSIVLQFLAYRLEGEDIQFDLDIPVMASVKGVTIREVKKYKLGSDDSR